MRFRAQVHASFLLKFVLVAAIVSTAAVSSLAQQGSGSAPRALTSADYQRAEKFMGYNTSPLVFHNVRAHWLPDDRFWYRDTRPDGSEFVVYDAAHGTRQPAFDHAKVAAALSAAGGKTYDAKHLPFMSFDFSSDGQSIVFSAQAKHWTCDVQGSHCTADAKSGERAAALPTEEVSPDGKSAAFIRDLQFVGSRCCHRQRKRNSPPTA